MNYVTGLLKGIININTNSAGEEQKNCLLRSVTDNDTHSLSINSQQHNNASYRTENEHSSSSVINSQLNEPLVSSISLREDPSSPGITGVDSSQEYGRSARIRKRNIEKLSKTDFSDRVPNVLHGSSDFRKRNRIGKRKTSLNRDSYNSISDVAVVRCHTVLKSVANFDWKLNGLTHEFKEDVALVINPHNHLVDDAWRKLRSHITEWNLVSTRQKMTDIEKLNCVPPLKRKTAFLVVIANNKKILHKVMAAERLRLGFVSSEVEEQADGLKLQGIPLTPSIAPACSSNSNEPGPMPTNTYSNASPAHKLEANITSESMLKNVQGGENEEDDEEEDEDDDEDDDADDEDDDEVEKDVD